MKKVVVAALIMCLISCKNEIPENNFVSLSGTVSNPISNGISIATRGYSKTIRVNADGSFSDTLSVTTGIYSLLHGSEADPEQPALKQTYR